jgi:Ca-activated chloride channel family protein
MLQITKTFIGTLALLFSATLSIANASASKQALPSATSNRTVQTSSIIETINGEQTIRLQELQITSEISGSMAETTVQMVFFNPNQRPLEGNLQFPLLPGQQVTEFSLDINGKLRTAVPVEKAKGRQVFEEIERRGVDPALLEVTQGNNFKLRVYPIPAKGTRTVQVKFAESLQQNGLLWAYRLPISYASDVAKSSIIVNVHGIKQAPSAVYGTKDISFVKYDDGYQLRLVDQAFSANAEILVSMAATSTAQTYIQERLGETYFLTEIPINNVRSPRVLPRLIGLLWDSSGSGANRALDAEINELDAYFKAFGNANVEVRLTRLRDRAEATEIFKISNGNWRALRKSIEATIYDGASALGDWKPERGVTEYLLFSDGLFNYGQKYFPSLLKGQHLYAINSSVSADTVRLSSLAATNDGRLIQINRETPGSAAQELLTEGIRVLEFSANNATELQIESMTPAGNLLRIAGKLQKKNAEISLKITQHGIEKTITLPISLAKDGGTARHSLAAHFWANYRLQGLQADAENQRAEIRRVGEKYGIPTSETSLIVLDSISDYVRYNITPPAEYITEYENLRTARDQQTRSKKLNQLENIVRQFQQKITWWETTFPKTLPVSKQDIKLSERPRDTRETQNAAVVTSAERQSLGEVRPVMPIRPVEAAPMALREDTQRVTVSGARVARVVQESYAQASVSYSNTDANRNASERTDQTTQVGSTLKKWTSNAPYITRMKAADKNTLYAIYLDERPSYLNSSAFFLDAADMLFEKGQRDLGLRVLSNLAEMDLENRHILRILGYRLMEAGAPELAIPMFKKVQRLAEEEPQSFRDLGLAFAADRQYQAAIDQLNEVVLRVWDGRFRDIQIITLAELNAVIATSKNNHQALDTSKIDPRLLKNMPLDIRVIMGWDADNSDMDLWVTDPNGEKCFYGHPHTRQGGRITSDVTQGYGPEEFSLRNAMPGKYKIEANFYGNRQQTVAGATTLQVRLSTDFGTGKAKDKMITLRLKDKGETVFVGEFEVSEPSADTNTRQQKSEVRK